MRWRYLFIIFIFTTCYLFLIYKLYNVQLNKSAYYTNLAEKQLLASGVLESLRGAIYFTDKNNNPIPAVLNKDFAVIFAVPKEIQSEAGRLSEGNIKSQENFIKKYAEIISPILGIKAEELERMFNKKNDSYELLAQKASEEQVGQIREIIDNQETLNLKGIYTTTKKLRFYSFENLASHLLGFVSPASEKDDEISKSRNIEIGRYGLELKFNESLAGETGYFDNDKISEPRDGNDLFLNIDRNIQAQAEEVIRNLIDKWEADEATVIVQDPATGKILAMANLPDFNPNSYSKSEIKNFLNPAVSAIYEPGSVFKVITMAVGIDSGKISPETTYIDNGSITLNGKIIRNWNHRAYGKITMTNVIEHSINTGSVFAERKIGHNIFENYMKRFGFNELTGVNLPSEVKGNIDNLKNGKDIDYATASFGQGVAVTPVRLVSAVSAIANGGILMKPLILADEKPEVIQRVISEKAADEVVKMMVSAVKKNILADIPNYNIAGKTGTAFIPDFKNGGYTDNVINTYVGFAPAFSPKFVILIKLENPKGAPLAGETVVPAFRELAQFILNYYNVSPDDLSENKKQKAENGI